MVEQGFLYETMRARQSSSSFVLRKMKKRSTTGI